MSGQAWYSASLHHQEEGKHLSSFESPSLLATLLRLCLKILHRSCLYVFHPAYLRPLYPVLIPNYKVDAEGSITGPKLLRAATAFLCQRPPVANDTTPDMTPKQLLDGIHIMRVTTQPEMLAFWYTLDDWLHSHPSVGLSLPSYTL